MSKLLGRILKMQDGAIRLAMCLVLLAFFAFSLRAQDSDAHVQILVHFPASQYRIVSSYANNAKAMEQLDSLLRNVPHAEIQKISIQASASPEGSYHINSLLAQKRALSLKNHILEQYPHLESRIEVSTVVQKWSFMEENPETSFTSLRYSSLSMDLEPGFQTVPSGSLLPIELPLPKEELSTSLANVEESSALSVHSFKPIIGVSTNLPYDLCFIPGYGVTSIPSISLEFYPSRGKYTFGADIEAPMWRHPEQHRYLQINNLTLWVRRYFKPTKTRFTGLYAFASANMARYGIGWNQKGWEGEGLGASLGIGYKKAFGRRFFMDMGVALGAFYSAYDPYVWGNDASGWYYYDYYGDPEAFKARNQRLFWFGPTRVYFSIGIDLF